MNKIKILKYFFYFKQKVQALDLKKTRSKKGPQGGGGMIVNDLSQRVHDLDQRLTLTEHANRAALDEVYGLRVGDLAQTTVE